jgi:hypothetical protein
MLHNLRLTNEAHASRYNLTVLGTRSGTILEALQCSERRRPSFLITLIGCNSCPHKRDEKQVALCRSCRCCGARNCDADRDKMAQLIAREAMAHLACQRARRASRSSPCEDWRRDRARRRRRQRTHPTCRSAPRSAAIGSPNFAMFGGNNPDISASASA